MSLPASRPRWLIIVRPDQHDLYSNLCQSCQWSPLVEVTLDRRRAERRTRTVPVVQEARQTMRRASPSALVRELWLTAGFRVLYMRKDVSWEGGAPEEE